MPKRPFARVRRIRSARRTEEPMDGFKDRLWPAGFGLPAFRRCRRRMTAAMAGALALALPAGGAAWAQEPLKLGVLNDLQGSFADLGGAGPILATQMAGGGFGGEGFGGAPIVLSAPHPKKTGGGGRTPPAMVERREGGGRLP